MKSPIRSTEPSQAKKSSQPDSFQNIHGIGPGLEARLYAARIRTYAQLAEMTPEKIVSTLGNVIGLTVKRIIEQDWIGQALTLESQKHTALITEHLAGRQHYATFTVELLLDEHNTIRRTRTACVQAEQEDTWAGWDPDRLVEFIALHSGARPVPQEESVPEPHQRPVRKPEQVPALPSIHTRVSGQLSHHGHILGKDEPFEITLPFVLQNVILPGEEEVAYRLDLNAKALGAGSFMKLAGAQGSFDDLKENEVTLKCPGLKEGVYRMVVDLTFSPPLLNPDSEILENIHLDGGVLQVH